MNEPATPSIIQEVVGSTAIVRFNRPAQKNSLSSDLLNSFDLLLTRLLNNSDLRAIVFTGTNDVFLSGAHIGELSTLDEAAAITFSQNGQKLMQRVANARQVTIAAVNGYCLGGGLDFALACDVRVASINATFAHPGTRLGINNRVGRHSEASPCHWQVSRS